MRYGVAILKAFGITKYSSFAASLSLSCYDYVLLQDGGKSEIIRS
jgi:hypothetical protein